MLASLALFSSWVWYEQTVRFFFEKYLGSAGKELSYQLQKWFRFVKKGKFSGNILWNTLLPLLFRRKFTQFTLPPSRSYIYMNLKEQFFSCFNNCFWIPAAGWICCFFIIAATSRLVAALNEWKSDLVFDFTSSVVPMQKWTDYLGAWGPRQSACRWDQEYFGKNATSRKPGKPMILMRLLNRMNVSEASYYFVLTESFGHCFDCVHWPSFCAAVYTCTNLRRR